MEGSSPQTLAKGEQTFYTLKFILLSASNLAKDPWYGQCAPFCTVSLDGKQVYSTRVKRNTVKPVWRENVILKVGDKIGVNHFVAGQKVDIVGVSQGKGFAGSMKRHNFGGMQATHGVSISHRSHGSTGNSQDPGRTWKGKKMAGQYGNVRVTTQNLTVIELIEEDSLILVKGSVPGSKNSILKMYDSIKHKTPENAPFPAGLIVDKVSDDNKNQLSAINDEQVVPDVENDGGKVEN